MIRIIYDECLQGQIESSTDIVEFRPSDLAKDLAALMDYLELEFRDEPAKRTVVCKHEKA